MTPVLHALLNKKRLLPSVAVGFAAALYFAIVLPVQTYLACVEAPTFSLGDLLREYVLYFGLAWIVVGAVLFALSYVPLAKTTIDAKGRRHRKISLQFHVFALAVVVAAIVEAGPLSLGLPKLNGEFAGYRSSARSWLDALALAAVLITPLACYRWLKRHVTWIAAAVAVYAAAPLFDASGARSPEEARDDMIIRGEIPRYDVVAGSAFSPSNNVMVLILDTVSTHVMSDIFRKDPEFARHFPGFVNYTNNLGMHWTTAVALPGIMTGRYYESSSDLATYGLAPFTSESFIKDYVDRDIPVYFNLALWPLGWSNRMSASQTTKEASRPSQAVIDNTLDLRLGDLALFRVVPYGLKERFALAVAARSAGQKPMQKSDAPQENVFRDEILWPLLASRPVDGAFPTTLHVHHSLGAHPPFTHDENGEIVNPTKREPTYGDYAAHCKFALKHLARCFDAWQANGVYDASTIIVISDHGVGTTWPETKPYLHGIPTYAFPALMVKARGDRAPFVESPLPTSHAKIAALVRSLSTRALTRDNVAEMLHAESRFCRTCDASQIVDWIASGDWTVQKAVHPDVQKDSSKLRKLELDKTYSFLITAPPEDYPDFIASNGARRHTGGMAMNDLAKPLEISFRAPAANETYDLILRVRFGFNPKGNLVHFVAKCGSATGSFMNGKANEDRNNYIVLKGCRSDDDGLVHVTIYYTGDVKRAGKMIVKLLEMRLSRNIAAKLVDNGFFPGKVEKSVDFLQSWRVNAAFPAVVGGGASLSGHGEGVTVDAPKWLLKNGGQGVSIEGHSLEGSFKLVCKGEGDVILSLLGVNRMTGGSRLRVYADFESFKINGKEMLKEPVQTCFEAGHRIPLHVKDGEVLDVSVRLRRHKYGYVELRRLLLDAQNWTYQAEQSVDGLLTLPAMQGFLSD